MPRGRPLRSRPGLAIYTVQLAVKYNAVSLRHKRNPETLFIHRNQCIYQVLVRQPFHSKPFLSIKILFSKISFFPKFCLILFYFINFFFIH